MDVYPWWTDEQKAFAEEVEAYRSLADIDRRVTKLEKEMQRAAKDLDFERAAELRDRIRSLKELVVL